MKDFPKENHQREHEDKMRKQTPQPQDSIARIPNNVVFNLISKRQRLSNERSTNTHCDRTRER